MNTRHLGDGLALVLTWAAAITTGFAARHLVSIGNRELALFFWPLTVLLGGFALLLTTFYVRARHRASGGWREIALGMGLMLCTSIYTMWKP